MTAKQLTEIGLLKMKENGIRRKLQLIQQLGGYEKYREYMRTIRISGYHKAREKFKDKQHMFKEWGRLGGLTVNQKYPEKIKEWKSRGGAMCVKTAPKKKIIGPKGEKMYNSNESKVATWLMRMKIPYEYEPIIKVPTSNGIRYLIPDFIANGNEIIEISTDSRDFKMKRIAEKFNWYKSAKFDKLTFITTLKNKNLGLLPKFVKILFLENIE
jgi:hypothetical protein